VRLTAKQLMKKVSFKILESKCQCYVVKQKLRAFLTSEKVIVSEMHHEGATDGKTIDEEG
jgi:hypothetical protein